MRFTYPAHLEQYSEDEIVVSFRDLPECLTSGEDEAEALIEAEDALEEAVAGRIDDGEPIPAPSAPLPGERMVALPIDMAAKAALTLVFRASGLTQSALAERLGLDRKVVQANARPQAQDVGQPSQRCSLRAMNSEVVLEAAVAAHRAVGRRHKGGPQAGNLLGYGLMGLTCPIMYS